MRSSPSPSALTRTQARAGQVGGREPEGGNGEAPERDSYQETPSGHAEDLDEAEERAEGERQQAELLEKYAPWSCSATAEMLEALLVSLLPYSQRMDVPYEFLALDTNIPFASSCCHGAIFFSRGLLGRLDRPGLEFFAAHEMAHTELRHFASRQRRLEELRRAIPAAPGSAARQRMEMAAVLAVRHQEEFEADHLAARWLDAERARQALTRLHELCLEVAPESLTVPTHPPFERRLRWSGQAAPPDPVEYLWSLLS